MNLPALAREPHFSLGLEHLPATVLLRFSLGRALPLGLKLRLAQRRIPGSASEPASGASGRIRRSISWKKHRAAVEKGFGSAGALSFTETS